jgi:transposase
MVSKVPKTRPAYADEFRRDRVQMLRAGRTPRELAESLGVSEQTLRTGAARSRSIAASATTASADREDPHDP